jgi:hypothetical protein
VEIARETRSELRVLPLMPLLRSKASKVSPRHEIPHGTPIDHDDVADSSISAIDGRSHDVCRNAVKASPEACGKHGWGSGDVQKLPCCPPFDVQRVDRFSKQGSSNWRDRYCSISKTLPPTIFLFSILVVVAAFAANALGATPTSKYVEPNVPTGTPVPGNYTGKYRPQVHFSPPQDFMNDPNGMFIDSNGTYHLYYQCTSTSNSCPKSYLILFR